MHPVLALALALALLSGAACAHDASRSTGAQGAAAADDDAGTDATAGSGSSQPSPPATQESQGMRLDNLASPPAPSTSGAAPGQDCSTAGAVSSVSRATAADDCGPGESGTQRH